MYETMTKTHSTTTPSPLWNLPSNKLFHLVLDFLNEADLSHVACVQRSPELQLCVSQAWMRLAMRYCRRDARGGDGNKGFPTAVVARTYLKLRHCRLRAEKGMCFVQDCFNKGKLRCSECSIAMFCSRRCHSANWKHHKRNCKKLDSIAMACIRSSKTQVINPWGHFVSSLRELEPSYAPGVYAEYDPTTFEVRAIGSFLNLADSLREKRLHNDGIFHVIVDGAWFLDQEVAHPFMHILFHHHPKNADSVYLALARAMEGAVAKTNVGTREENFELFMETFVNFE